MLVAFYLILSCQSLPLTQTDRHPDRRLYIYTYMWQRLQQQTTIRGTGRATLIRVQALNGFGGLDNAGRKEGDECLSWKERKKERKERGKKLVCGELVG